MKYWLYIAIAGVFECVWAVGLKYTEGFTRLLPTAGTVAAIVISFYFMALALQKLPMGTAYAVWTGIGAVGVATFGMLFLGESRDILRIFCILLIVAGIIGLKLVSASPE
ncbi:quaternary ammonium compound efflux SMR transporter SugE [Kistimonas asteriae]|uniref:quaternary ammonium compound efflux SMR transporter SugE n=1 Tax=Kistimonas asteriae TaxID=517724 RepID=UPI001BA8242D